MPRERACLGAPAPVILSLMKSGAPFRNRGHRRKFSPTRGLRREFVLGCVFTAIPEHS